MAQRHFWNDQSFATADGGNGFYEVEARAGYTRIKANVQNNEAGFRGRHWEVTGATHAGVAVGVGDNQFPSLKAAAEALISIAESYESTRKMAVRAGLRFPLPGDEVPDVPVIHPERWETANREPDRRTPINIHPEAQAALQSLLVHDSRFKGVGYSEFIFRAVKAVREASL